MKKILIAALAVIILAVSCEGTGSGEHGMKGTFVTDSGISVELSCAYDVYASETQGIYVHALMFTNAEGAVNNDDYVLANGERADAFMVMFFSLSDQVGSGDIPPMNMDMMGGLPEFPGWMYAMAVGFEGTADPDNPKDLYILEGDAEEDGQPVLNVVRNGDMYEISFRDVVLYDGEGKPVKGTLLYEGKLDRMDGSGMLGDVQADLMSLMSVK